MSTSVRQSLQVTDRLQSKLSASQRQSRVTAEQKASGAGNGRVQGQKPRAFLSAGTRLLREALSRQLLKSGEIEVVGMDAREPFQTEDLLRERADVLLLSSRGNLSEDLTAIRRVRAAAPKVQVLVIDGTCEEGEFLQCVRAGVHGYLPQDASAEDVVEGIQALEAGEAVCPGVLCAALFRCFEREGPSFPSASAHRRLGLTRREQQLIPLIAEGLTNKEIANRFCLSEQTVKNHLYRMKHKIGADDRLGIVQACRTQGFLV